MVSLFVTDTLSWHFHTALVKIRVLCFQIISNFKSAVGIVLHLSFCFCPFLFTGSLSVIVCEGKTKEIRCKSRSKICVLWANYGRLNPKTHSSIKTINCRASTSLNNVRNICQGKTACIRSNALSSGDSCRGTYKYLLIANVKTEIKGWSYVYPP